MSSLSLANGSDDHLLAANCESPEHTEVSGATDELYLSTRPLPYFSADDHSQPTATRESLDKVYTCSSCDLTATRCGDFGTQPLAHGNETQFECPPCRNIVSEPGNVDRHTASVYKDHPHICSRCGRRFTNFDKLVVHQRGRGGDCPAGGNSFDEIISAKASPSLDALGFLGNYVAYREPYDQLSSNVPFNGSKDQWAESQSCPLYASKIEGFPYKVDFSRYGQNYSMTRFLSAFDPFSRSEFMTEPLDHLNPDYVQHNAFHVLEFTRSLKEETPKIREKEFRDANMYSSGRSEEDLFSETKKGREWVDEDPSDTVSSSSIRNVPDKQGGSGGINVFGDDDSPFAPVDDWLNRTYRNHYRETNFHSTADSPQASNLPSFNDDWIAGIPQVSDYFVKNLPVEWYFHDKCMPDFVITHLNRSCPGEQDELEPAHGRTLDPSPYHAGSKSEWQNFHSTASANLLVSPKPVLPGRRRRVLELLYVYQAAITANEGPSATNLVLKTHSKSESPSEGIATIGVNVSAINITGQSSSTTKQLHPILKARKALMRQLGACTADCRVRRVKVSPFLWIERSVLSNGKCKLHHHALWDLVEKSGASLSDIALVDWAMKIDDTSRAQSFQTSQSSLNQKSATRWGTTIAATVKNEEENVKQPQPRVNCTADAAMRVKLDLEISKSEDEISMLDDETVWSDSESSAEVGRDIAGPLINSVQQLLVNEIMSEILGLFDKEWSRDFNACPVNSETPSKPSGVSGMVHAKQEGAQKRPRADGDEDGSPSRENNDERDPKRPARDFSPLESPEAVMKLACPFHKHDRRKYGLPNFKTCKENAWPDVGRLKGHLYRRHRVPIHCPRCKQRFKTVPERELHFEQENCDLRHTVAFDGISTAMEDRLRRKHLPFVGQSQPDRWRDIYMILFPYDINVPSPYFNPDEENESYEAYCRQQLPRVFKKNLERLLSPELESLKRVMIGRADEIMKICIDEISANYATFQCIPCNSGIQNVVPIRKAASATIPHETKVDQTAFPGVEPPPTPPSTSSFPRQNAFEYANLPAAVRPLASSSEESQLPDSDTQVTLEMIAPDFDYPPPPDNDSFTDMNVFNDWELND